jgi:hypothetical protein
MRQRKDTWRSGAAVLALGLLVIPAVLGEDAEPG